MTLIHEELLLQKGLEEDQARFLATVLELLDDARRELGVRCWIGPLTGIAAVASDFGKMAPCNNIFGVQVSAQWERGRVVVSYEETIRGKTFERSIALCAYPNLRSACADYLSLLLGQIGAAELVKHHAPEDKVGLLFRQPAWMSYLKEILDRRAGPVIEIVRDFELWRWI